MTTRPTRPKTPLHTRQQSSKQPTSGARGNTKASAVIRERYQTRLADLLSHHTPTRDATPHTEAKERSSSGLQRRRAVRSPYVTPTADSRTKLNTKPYRGMATTTASNHQSQPQSHPTSNPNPVTAAGGISNATERPLSGFPANPANKTFERPTDSRRAVTPTGRLGTGQPGAGKSRAPGPRVEGITEELRYSKRKKVWVWTQHYDPAAQRMYYHNHRLKTTTWEKPDAEFRPARHRLPL